MTSRERIEAVIAGKPVDRPPFAAWGPHMNMVDHHVMDFAKATCDYEENYGFDLIKIMPNGIYHTEDYGQVIDWTADPDFPNFLCSTKTAFQSLDDWRNVTPKDVTKGAFGREVEVARRVVEHFKGEVPVIATVASPIQTVQFGAGNLHEYLGITIKEMYAQARLDKLYPMCDYFAAHETEYRHLMDVLSETTMNLMQAYLDAGVDGFFYGMLPLRKQYISKENFEKWIKPYDVKILNSVQDRAKLTMIHVHGESDLLMDSVLDYPCNAINWDDCLDENPSLAEMRAKTDKILVGGINRFTDMMGADRDAIKKRLHNRVEEAIKEAGPRLIVSGGCEWPRQATYRFYVWKEVMDEFLRKQ